MHQSSINYKQWQQAFLSSHPLPIQQEINTQQKYQYIKWSIKHAIWQKHSTSTYVFFICAFSAYRFLANLLPLAPSNCHRTNARASATETHQKKWTEEGGGGGNINSLSPAGHPWIACAPRAPPACACAPRSPGAGHGASGEALCDLPAAAANSSRGENHQKTQKN